MKGLSHLEAAHPCKDYGPKCWKCRLQAWCIAFQEKQPEKGKKEYGEK